MERKYVLITGSAHGLGKALAIVFARNKYNIILHDLDKNNLEKVKNQILKNGVECFSVVGDIRSDKTIEKLSRISRKKDAAVLVNNAGVHCPYLPLEKISNTQIDVILITNLIAPIKLTKKIYQYFLERGDGTIININSLSGLKNHEFRSIYSASKWGLRGFSDTLKLEANKNHIRILDVYPSRIKTRPEFTLGMEPEIVAQKIYDAFRNTDVQKIELNWRKEK